MSDAEILFERRGKLGLITLNRPKTLNALTHEMLMWLEHQLVLWRDDDSVEVVAIQGAGDRAFCAGGDIRALYEQGLVDRRSNFKLYADEYRINTRIKRFPKPYVGLMDGVVMGGGVGVSIHGALRVATERTVFAMPETAIGLFPDVGGTYFLPRLPGQVGMWLGLTGNRLRGIDAVAGGTCDLFVESGDLPRLVEALADGDLPEPAAERPALPHADEIDAMFGADSLEAILAALVEAGTEWAAREHDLILAKSPTCTRIAFRQIREGAHLEFEDCMRLEYRLARFCMMHPDFYEGVRAVIIDKDHRPNWSPATLAEADDAYVAPAFEPLPADEELRLS
jgi:enoyl-CoA hydratase